MTANPLRQAHKVAEKNLDQIGNLFGQLGDANHPNSKILVAYRNANRALRSSLDIVTARDVTGQLKDSVLSSARLIFNAAVNGGAGSAIQQLMAYGRNPTEITPQGTVELLALDVLESRLDTQAKTILAMLYGNIDPSMILGDESRQGVLRPNEIITTGAYWVASLWWEQFAMITRRYPGFSKQVIAALDERTTDCCLRAHAQIRPLEGQFHLTGTPRYADYLDWTPFHHRCRSSVALYMAGYDDGLTDLMLEGSARIMAERAVGGSGYRHPADAFGR